MKEILLVVLFVAAALAGYRIIKNVPSLLHTPLMSGMNALSGIPVMGALVATSVAVTTGNKVLGLFAILLAAINIVGGFGVTHKMLKMFKKEDKQ